MARTTEAQVKRALKKAQRAEIDQKIRDLKYKIVAGQKVRGKHDPVPLTDVEKAYARAEIVNLRHQRDKLRVRRNGNGKKKKNGIF